MVAAPDPAIFGFAQQFSDYCGRKLDSASDLCFVLVAVNLKLFL